MNPDRFGLKEETIAEINSVFGKYDNIKKIILYGSRAKGNFKPGSDIDLTLFGKDLTTTDLLKIENELDDLMLPYQIDLSLHHKIDSSELLEHIERVGVEFLG